MVSCWILFFKITLPYPIKSQFVHHLQSTVVIVEACRTGVIYCVFKGNRGKSEASAKRELRAMGGSLKNLAGFLSDPPLACTQLALASLLPLSPEIREEFRVFCRLLLS